MDANELDKQFNYDYNRNMQANKLTAYEVLACIKD